MWRVAAGGCHLSLFFTPSNSALTPPPKCHSGKHKCLSKSVPPSLEGSLVTTSGLSSLLLGRSEALHHHRPPTEHIHLRDLSRQGCVHTLTFPVMVTSHRWLLCCPADQMTHGDPKFPSISQNNKRTPEHIQSFQSPRPPTLD